MSRQLVVVDLETTGLHDEAVPLEVAAINVDTGDELHFVPFVSTEELSKAQPEAMEINRYYERATYRLQLDRQGTTDAWREVRNMLQGNTFAGSNPTFDSALVARQFVNLQAMWTFGNGRETTTLHGLTVGRVWHHRLADLAAYAGGKFDVDPTELQGLDGVLALLYLNGEHERHTALGDARATAAAFDLLRNTPSSELLREFTRTTRDSDDSKAAGE